MKTVLPENADPNFKHEVASKIGLEEIKPCYACGSCTGVCPVREVIEDFDPRRLIHMIVLGLRKDVLSGIQKMRGCLKITKEKDKAMAAKAIAAIWKNTNIAIQT